jgi:hypothetical protein
MDKDAVHDSALAGDVDGLAAALSAAARLGEGSVVTELNGHGWSPLHCACITGDRQTVNMLLTAGAKSNAKSSPAGETPLHFAAAWDHREVVDTLLSRGAFLEETNHAGATHLHKACEYGAENAAAELLQRGASCFLVDSFGRTPLHVAAKHNASAVVLQLLAAGADVDAKDNRGRRPVDLASAATAVLLTASSDDHPLHVWLADKGLLDHADLFRSYGVTGEDLTNGLDEHKLQTLGMPVGVRLKVMTLMKGVGGEQGSAALGASSRGNASVRPLGDVDWQMTEGGEWYKTTPTPLLSTGHKDAAGGQVNLQVIDPWDYDDTEWAQKYGPRDDSPANSRRSNSSPSASSPAPKPRPQPQPEPEPEPEAEAQVESPSLKERASLLRNTAVDEPVDTSDIDAPWENDSDDAVETTASEVKEKVRPWFRREVQYAA